MNNIEIIEKTRLLEEKKEELEKALAKIHSEIASNHNECSHIGGMMGTFVVPHKCRCLLCNAELTKYQTNDLCARNLIVYAGNYAVDKNLKYEEKFDAIQTMLLGLSRNNKDMTNEEIVELFNSMIDANKDVEINTDVKTYKKVYI